MTAVDPVLGNDAWRAIALEWLTHVAAAPPHRLAAGGTAGLLARARRLAATAPPAESRDERSRSATSADGPTARHLAHRRPGTRVEDLRRLDLWCGAVALVHLRGALCDRGTTVEPEVLLAWAAGCVGADLELPVAGVPTPVVLGGRWAPPLRPLLDPADGRRPLTVAEGFAVLHDLGVEVPTQPASLVPMGVDHTAVPHLAPHRGCGPATRAWPAVLAAAFVDADIREICLRCCLPTTVVTMTSGRPGWVERCWCGRIPSEVREVPLPDRGPITEWQDRGRALGRTILCQVCAAVDLPSTHRFQPIVCARCMGQTQALNNLMGQVVVPVGTHSIVNQVRPIEDLTRVPDVCWTAAAILAGELDGPEPDPISDFFRASRTASKGRWRHTAAQIRRTLDEACRLGLLDLPEDAEVIDRDAYVAAASKVLVDRDAALLALVTEIAADLRAEEAADRGR